MAKFNLKKILMSDYEVDLVQATNFEQWVGKNMDYEAVMEKNFRDVSFKSSKANKKDFLKDLKTRALKLDPIQSVKDILNLFEEDGSKVNIKLYDEIRKLELELKEVKEKNDIQSKRIVELSSKKENVFTINEIQKKIISEYRSYLKGFDLGFDISEYEKAIGRVMMNNHVILKGLLVEIGIGVEKADEIFIRWKSRQYENFREELNSDINFKNYEENREELREQFDFIKKNSEFLNTVMKLKGMEVAFNKKEKTEKEGHVLRLKELIELGSVFTSCIITGKEHKTSWGNACNKVFGTTSRKVVFDKIGVDHESFYGAGHEIITIFDSLDVIVEKFNKKALEVLENEINS